MHILANSGLKKQITRCKEAWCFGFMLLLIMFYDDGYIIKTALSKKIKIYINERMDKLCVRKRMSALALVSFWV